MRTLTITLAMLATSVALAQNQPLTVTETGIDGENLADTPLSEPIHMEATGKRTNQLSLTIAVTPGTSTRIWVTCYESELKTSGFSQIPFCDSEYPSNCHPDVREFTLSEYTTVSGKKYIASRWEITKQWSKCSVDDPDDGTGTVILTGTRSSQ